MYHFHKVNLLKCETLQKSNSFNQPEFIDDEKIKDYYKIKYIRIF